MVGHPVSFLGWFKGKSYIKKHKWEGYGKAKEGNRRGQVNRWIECNHHRLFTGWKSHVKEKHVYK